MYVQTYIYIRICMYLCVCVCVYIYIYIYIYEPLSKKSFIIYDLSFKIGINNVLYIVVTITCSDTSFKKQSVFW